MQYDIVKFHTPNPDESPDTRFILLDEPACDSDRVDIRLICDLPIPPVQRVLAADLCPKCEAQ